MNSQLLPITIIFPSFITIVATTMKHSHQQVYTRPIHYHYLSFTVHYPLMTIIYPWITQDSSIRGLNQPLTMYQRQFSRLACSCFISRTALVLCSAPGEKGMRENPKWLGHDPGLASTRLPHQELVLLQFYFLLLIVTLGGCGLYYLLWSCCSHPLRAEQCCN